MAAWIAQHGGEIDEKWRQQEARNVKIDDTFEKIFNRIDTLTTRIAWATGAAVMLGAVIAMAFEALASR